MPVATPDAPVVDDPEVGTQFDHADDAPVQRPPRHHTAPGAHHRIEGLLIFALFGAAFGGLGYWVVCTLNVVPFDALDRLTRALMVWHNNPPKLAAIGFAFPPLTTVVLLPFVIFSAVGSSLIALPLCSAIFGGFTMVGLNRALRRSGFGIERYLGLLLIAANPIVAFAASSGGSSIVGISLATIALGAVVGWYATVDSRFLVSGGLAFSLACIASYAFIPWWIIGAGVVGVTLSRHRATGSEVEGSLIMFLLPGVFVLGIWILFNNLVIGDPISWLTHSGTTTVNAASSSGVTTNFGEVAKQTGSLVLTGAPLAILVLPALIISAVTQRNELAAWLALFLVAAIVTPPIIALGQNDLSQIRLHSALPILLVSLIGVMWLHQSVPWGRAPIAAVALVALIVSVPISWNALDRYPYQSMEQAFHRAVATGDDQEGTTSRGGLQVGILSERAMAEFLKKDGHRVLTDNSQTFGVIALDGSPAQFVDRADAGDAAWRRAALRPPLNVRYFLFAKNAPDDGLRQLYPQAALGEDPRFLTVFDTPRYRLVAVPEGLGRTLRVDAVTPGQSTDQSPASTPEQP